MNASFFVHPLLRPRGTGLPPSPLEMEQAPRKPYVPRMLVITCQQCGASAEKKSDKVFAASKAGKPLYCGRVCASLVRRTCAP